MTIVGPDRPGLVSLISDRITSFGGNWLESRMANLAGQFAGIVHVQVAPERAEALIGALKDLETHGLRVVVTRGAAQGSEDDARRRGRSMRLELVGQDRPGIMREISHALASREISIDQLETDCVSGSMSGESLIRARATLQVPEAVGAPQLREALEALANDLMVDVALEEASR